MASNNGYPKREPFFAYRYCRLLAKTCAAQDIGHIAFTLCVTIAQLEDAKRYTSPVTFYNDQLLPVIGIQKWVSLDRARKRASEFGWLHYENNGKRRPGVYWVTVPPQFGGLPDGSCDEGLYPLNGYNRGDNDENNLTQSDVLYPRNGDRRGDRRGDNGGDNGGEPSSLTLTLPTDRPTESLRVISDWRGFNWLPAQDLADVTIRRMAAVIPRAEKNQRLLLFTCALVVHGDLPKEDLERVATETVDKHDAKRPWAYFKTCIVNQAKVRGINFNGSLDHAATPALRKPKLNGQRC